MMSMNKELEPSLDDSEEDIKLDDFYSGQMTGNQLEDSSVDNYRMYYRPYA